MHIYDYGFYGGVSFAIDPKGDLDKHVNYVIKDMKEIIDFLKN